jgi:hypothetical protein
VFAGEIASNSGNGIGPGTWIELEKWFFFNRIDMGCYDSIIDEAKEGSIYILPYPTDAVVPILYSALVVTKIALYFIVRELFIEHGLFHNSYFPLNMALSNK